MSRSNRLSASTLCPAVAVVVAVVAVLNVLLEPVAPELGVTRRGDLAGAGLALLAALPLAVVWRFPWPATIATVSATVAAVLLGYSASIFVLMALIALGVACAFVAAREAVPLTALVLIAMGVTAQLAPQPLSTAGLVINGVAFVLAALLGGAAQVQRRYARDLEERSAELLALRQVETRAAVEHERLRIAREVHDVVGHALAAITIHSRVARRRLTSDPPSAATAIDEIEALSTSALSETREAIGRLRSDDELAELRPRPGLDDLDELIARLRSPELHVELDRDAPTDGVSTAVQAAAFRIVQESLSNVAKHAQRGSALVTLRQADGALRIEVRDDGPPVAPGREGHGLPGMRERAAALGGSFDAGPVATGGWLVRATLPTASAAAAS